MKLGTRLYLGVSGVAIVAVVGAPLTTFPDAWARAIGWSQPPRTPLERYLMRSLGAIGIALGATCCVAALGRRPPRGLLLLLPAIGAGAVVVHGLGALRREVPPREALEIPFLAVWTLWGASVWARELVRWP